MILQVLRSTEEESLEPLSASPVVGLGRQGLCGRAHGWTPQGQRLDGQERQPGKQYQLPADALPHLPE